MDPDGNYIESAWDAFSLSMGITSLVNNVKQGNWGGALVDLVGVAVDAVALATPLPGGASAGLQGLKALNKVDNVVDVVKTTDVIKGLNNSQIDIALSAKNKTQHAAQHLVDAGIITKGDVVTQASAIYRDVLKNPDGVIDYTLRGGVETTAYLGKMETGEDIMILVRKDNGLIATSFVPNDTQRSLFD